MAIETTRITSEALQASIRSLLPSQVGFGDDLHATNLITPIIDLTAVAESSGLSAELQQSINFGGATAFQATGSTVTLANTAGFYKIDGTCVMITPSSSTKDVSVTMTDGATTKNVWRMTTGNGTGNTNCAVPVELIFFVAIGVTLAVTASSNTQFSGSIRQIADVSGNLSLPVGFTGE